MKSVVYVTTSTSGSASIGRVINALLCPPYTPLAPPAAKEGKPRVADSDPEGRIYLVRGVSEVAAPVYDPRFRYIVNFRDPRDTLCNQYHWLVQHPPGGAGDDEKRARILADRKARHALGIDASVLRVRDDKGFGFVFEMQAAAASGADVLFISYAQLCCAFERMVERMVAFLGVTPTEEALAKIALERPENLSSNPNWIGQDWTGTDSTPGRHRQELKPETIATLNQRFAPTLARLKEMELPELRSLYD